MLRVTVTSSGCTAPSDSVVVTDPVTYLPSAYEAVDNFTIDIVFEGKYLIPGTVDPITGLMGADTYQYANATNVTSTYNWASKGITFSKPNAYTVRLTGPAPSVFVDQFYEFVMPDYTIKRMNPNTTEPFLSLSHYSMPNPTLVMLSYPFVVTIPTTYGSGVNTNENITMNQWFYWKYQVAVANVANLRSRGLK